MKHLSLCSTFVRNCVCTVYLQVNILRVFWCPTDSGQSAGDVAPSMVIAPSHTSTIRRTSADSSVNLECVVSASPIQYITILWYRVLDGQREEILAGPRHLLSLYKRKLTIKNPSTSDTGVYECVGTFSRPGDPNSPSVAAQANLTVFGR